MPQGQAWWWEQLHPDDQEGDKFDVEEAVGSGRSIVREYRVRHKDGRWLDVEDRAMLLRDDAGKPVKMVGCTVDVTERKRAEEALRQKVEEIRTLLDTLPIGVFIAHDPEVTASPATGLPTTSSGFRRITTCPRRPPPASSRRTSESAETGSKYRPNNCPSSARREASRFGTRRSTTYSTTALFCTHSCLPPPCSTSRVDAGGLWRACWM